MRGALWWPRSYSRLDPSVPKIDLGSTVALTRIKCFLKNSYQPWKSLLNSLNKWNQVWLCVDGMKTFLWQEDWRPVFQDVIYDTFPNQRSEVKNSSLQREVDFSRADEEKSNSWNNTRALLGFCSTRLKIFLLYRMKNMQAIPSRLPPNWALITQTPLVPLAEFDCEGGATNLYLQFLGKSFFFVVFLVFFFCLSW